MRITKLMAMASLVIRLSRSLGTKKIKIAPSKGTKVMTVRIGKLIDSSS